MELMLPSTALTKPFIGVVSTKSKKESSVSNEKLAFHAFTIGTIGMLIPPDTISELAENITYCQLPNTNPILHGMANLRGNIIPIFDLHSQLNIETSLDTPRKVLVIGDGEDAAALLIDELPIRIFVSQDDKYKGIPTLTNELQQHVKTCYQANEKIWFDVDMPSLFSDFSNFI